MRGWDDVAPIVIGVLVACSSETPAPPPTGSTGRSVARLTVAVSGPGTVRSASPVVECRTSCVSTLLRGTRVHLEAVPDLGAEFTGWQGPCTGRSSCDFDFFSETQVGATFANASSSAGRSRIFVSISGNGSGRVRSVPAGIDCPGSCTATVQRGASVTLTAEAESGASFEGWGGICRGSGDCGFVVATDTIASASFAMMSRAAECAGMVPEPLRPPAIFRTERGRAEGTYCMPGTSNGAGMLVLPTENVNRNPLFHFSFIDPEGTVLNTYDGNWHVMIDQLDGFEAVDTAEINSAPWNLVVFSATGAVRRKVPAPGAFFVNNPVGGVVVSGQSTIVSFDENGSTRFELLAPDAFFAVDRQGNMLVFSSNRSSGDFSRFQGQWVDPTGHVGAPFTAIDGLPSNYMLTPQPRIGSGLLLHLASWDPPTGQVLHGSWVRQFEPLVAASSAAPPWLAGRGAMRRMHMAHGGRAYLLLPDPEQQVGVCSQRVEVVAPSGASCGFVDFDIAPGPCTTASIDVGYDGTVIQQLPRELERIDAQGNATCTWRYWPGYFR